MAQKKDENGPGDAHGDHRFPPPAEFRKAARVSDESIYERAAADPQAFWAGFAEELRWETPWKKIHTFDPPDAKWFIGGKLNACVNCVDRHCFYNLQAWSTGKLCF